MSKTMIDWWLESEHSHACNARNIDLAVALTLQLVACIHGVRS